MYNLAEHTRLLAVKERTLDLHAILQEQAKLASNPEVATALNEAADALDAWLHDEITEGALKIVERMEEDAGVSDWLREQRQMRAGAAE